MILTIDVGNTNVVFGLFSGKRLLKEWRFPAKKFKLPKIKTKLSAVIVASVVPSLNRKLKTGIRKQFECTPFFVTAENIPGLKVRLKKK
ncbi:MAG: type III pantothenate kinase, partial [Candidatus Margulisiibacteriota bacterium]